MYFIKYFCSISNWKHSPPQILTIICIHRHCMYTYSMSAILQQCVLWRYFSGFFLFVKVNKKSVVMIVREEFFTGQVFYFLFFLFLIIYLIQFISIGHFVSDFFFIQCKSLCTVWVCVWCRTNWRHGFEPALFRCLDFGSKKIKLDYLRRVFSVGFTRNLDALLSPILSVPCVFSKL